MAKSAGAKSVTDLLLFFEKTVRAVKIYPPANPHCRDFLARLHLLLTALLEEHGTLALSVSRFELLWEGETVYANSERVESLAFLLFKDGLLELTLRRGLEARELQELVGAFNRDFTVDYLNDDVGTYLWERDLPHVSFHLSEAHLDDALPEELRGEGEGQYEAARNYLHVEHYVPERLRALIHEGVLPRGAAHAAIPLRRPALTPARIALTAEETALLRDLQERDERHVFFEEMLEAVFSIFLQLHPEGQLQPYFALFRTLFESFFAEGDLPHALVLLRRLRALADSPAAVSRQAEQFLVDLGGSDLIPTLGRSLEADRVADPELLPELLELLPPTAIPRLTALLGALSSMKMRRLVCEALASLGARNVRLLGEELHDPRWYVVRNLAYTLGLVGGRTAVPLLAQLVDHDDARVRKEALRSLGKIPQPDALRLLLQTLDRPDPALRLAALRSLPKAAPAAAAAQLARIADAPGFLERPSEERAELARALGRLSGDDAVPALEQRLRQRWIRGARRRESRHFALLALVARNSAPAREAVRRSLDLLEGETRTLAEAFLAGRSGAAAPGARERP